MSLETKLKDTNYRAKVVELTQFEDHANADRLKITTVDFMKIAVGLDEVVGSLHIYFPIESAISNSLLGFNNLFRKAEFGNSSETKTGYFEKYGRVKAVKFRGEISEGFLISVENFNRWIKNLGINYVVTKDNVGETFDSIGEHIVCKKYVPTKLYNSRLVREKTTLGKFLDDYNMTVDAFNTLNETTFTLKSKLNVGEDYLVPKNRIKGIKSKKEDRLVQDQMRLHVDTEQLKRNLHKINPDDIITISEKLHGTSTTQANILIKKKLSLVEKIAQKFGVDVVDKEYAVVSASRRVIKDEYITKSKNVNFYDFDIWNSVKGDVENKIMEGYTLYGEIVGYLPSKQYIQKDFDYGCEEGKYEFYVYRITYTTQEGRVIELTHPQVERYCEKYELQMPDTHYHGRAGDYIPNIDVSDTRGWSDEFLKTLQENFNEMDCPMCKNSVPREGVIIRKEADTFEAYKLKSLRFLEKESKMLDTEDVSIEDQG